MGMHAFDFYDNETIGRTAAAPGAHTQRPWQSQDTCPVLPTVEP